MSLPPDPPLPTNNACAGKVGTIDKVIEKIRAARMRVGFNLWFIFRDVDDYKTNYISESKFLSVLLGPLKNIIGLDAEDITLLLYTFKALDGRIAYTQLCRLVHDNEGPPIETDEDKNRENVYTSNKLSAREEERVVELLTKIATRVPPQRIILKPFFQDYELIKRGSGQLSKNTFVRILHFLDIELASHDMNILFNKYRYDAFTIKYNAFLKELNGIYQYLIDHGYLDNTGNYRVERVDGDGRIQPQPELETAPRGEEYGIMQLWANNKLGQSHAFEAGVAFNKIKEHVLREKIRVEDYFKHYDPEDVGRVPKQVMAKCLNDWLCVSETAFNNLYLAPWEIEMLFRVYEDPKYQEKVLWKVFMDDLERDVPVEELKTWPHRGLERVPMNPFVVLHRPPTPPDRLDSTLEEALEHLKSSMEARPHSRKLLSVLSKYIRDTQEEMVPLRKFHWSLIECGIHLSESELEQIRNNYGTKKGIDWIRLSGDLRDLAADSSFNALRNQLEYTKEQSQKSEKITAELLETNIVEVLAKIKNKAICKRIWIRDSLKPFDKLNKQLITRDEFQRGLDNCGISLTQKEMEAVLDVFAFPENPSMIEYKRFCCTVDEDSLPPCLTRLPLKEAMAKEEAKETLVLPLHQYTNFEGRIALGNAMDKLAKYITLANTDFFKSLDKTNSGTMNRIEFQRALYKLNCLHLISNRELDTVLYSFGLTKELDVELDYMSFLNALDIIHKTKKAAKTL